MAWLVDQFGIERLLSTKVILPTAEFFPDPYSPTPQSARSLLDRVCGFMGVKPEQIELDFYSPEAGNTAGLYDRTAERAKVWLEVSDVEDPGPVVAVMAHEVAHHLLLGEGRLTGEKEDHEPLTDLLTIFLGFGLFTTKSLLRETNFTAGNWNYSKWQRRGYLSFPACGYALAIFARNRQETNPAWADYLRADVKDVFAAGARFLAITARSGLSREGPCPYYLQPRDTPVPEDAEGEPWDEIETPADRVSDFEQEDDRPDADQTEERESDSHFSHGCFLAGEGQHEEAAVAFTEAIRLDPSDVEAHTMRSKCYRKLNRFREAYSDAERAMQLDPDDMDCYRARARAAFWLANFATTIADCDRLLLDDCEDAGIFHLRGLARDAAGDFEGALSDFGNAIRHNPRVAVFYKHRADTLRKLGRYDDACRDDDEAARRDPFSTQSE
jgi:tetratricopeptide (TPR) repeat protein